MNDPDILLNRKENNLSTIYGDPSDCLIEGEIKGVNCVLLARHGRKHDVMPSNVNYRANIWALKELGCTHIIASTATGSLRKCIKPGDFVIPNSFIDRYNRFFLNLNSVLIFAFIFRTSGRKQTFYDGEPNHPRGVCHLPMEPAFSDRLRQLIIKTAEEIGLKNVHPNGNVVTIEGPRFSSKAESLMHKQWGGDVVNMTTVPEVVLAKEAGLVYAIIAMATDYDCLSDPSEHVNHNKVLEMFKKNVTVMTGLITSVVAKIGEENWDETIQEAQVI